jgi:ADP-ribose pyrophosphatase
VTPRRPAGYSGKIIDVYLETVKLPNGRITELEIVRHPGGAAAVALDARGRVCLLRQYRHVAGGWLWELPAGKIDSEEDPLLTARRELEEEAGIRAGRWDSLGDLLSSPGVFTEVVHLYLARDLALVEPATAEDEVIEVHWLPFTEALSWAYAGEVRDAKTIIGLLRARWFVQRESPE